MNPFGQVPVIEDGALTLSDSNAILIYLALRYDTSGQWLPRDPVRRRAGATLAFVSRRARWSTAPAMRAVNVLFQRPQDPRCADIAASLFKRMDDHLATQAYLVGEQPTIADIAMYAYTAHAPEGGVSLQAVSAIARLVATHRGPARLRRHACATRPWHERATVHAGERALQQRLGVHERMAEVMGQVVRNAMPAQHIELFEKLPTLWVGGLDAQGRPWATVLSGWPGFMHAPDAQHLRVEPCRRPATRWPCTGMPLGLLGLELAHPAAQPHERHAGGAATRTASRCRSTRVSATARSTSRRVCPDG